MSIKKLLIIPIFLFFFLITNQALATTNIDSTYRYAWGENIGWVDFGSSAGNVQVSNETLTGYAYGENIGWINLLGVTNNNEGALSGYAWGENVGFIDFSKVIIGTDGIFSGSAYGENIGWIIFGTTYNKVSTDWRPSSSSPQHTSISTGSSAQSRYNNLLLMGNTKAAEAVKKEFPNYIISSTTSTPSTILDKNSGVATISRTLKITIPMMKGDDIKILQTYLNNKGYNCGLADGIFGKLTKQAVILFQKANNLTTDGIVGPLTRSKLK